MNALKILSFTLVFPNPGEQGLGLFVRARLQQMAPDAEIKVMSLPGSRPHLLDEYNEDRARYAQKDHINE